MRYSLLWGLRPIAKPAELALEMNSMDNTNNDAVPDGNKEHINAVTETPKKPSVRPGSHAAWLRSQSDEQLRLVVQVLSRHQGLYRI